MRVSARRASVRVPVFLRVHVLENACETQIYLRTSHFGGARGPAPEEETRLAFPGRARRRQPRYGSISFENCQLAPKIMAAANGRGFCLPTPIHSHTGRNLVIGKLESISGGVGVKPVWECPREREKKEEKLLLEYIR